jgi:hypothetical protein
MPNTGSFTKHLNKNCTCSAERKKEILDHISSESSHHVTSEGETAWSFDVALPHHIRWVLKTIYNSNSLDSGARWHLRGRRNLLNIWPISFYFCRPGLFLRSSAAQLSTPPLLSPSSLFVLYTVTLIAMILIISPIKLLLARLTLVRSFA